VLAEASVWKLLLKQNFTVHVPLLTVTITFQLEDAIITPFIISMAQNQLQAAKYISLGSILIS